MSEIKDRLTLLYGLADAIVPLPETSRNIQKPLELDVVATWYATCGQLQGWGLWQLSALHWLFPMALPSPKQSLSTIRGMMWDDKTWHWDGSLTVPSIIINLLWMAAIYWWYMMVPIDLLSYCAPRIAERPLQVPIQLVLRQCNICNW